MSTPEPGLDRHEWEPELESLREGLEDAPAQALPDLADLVGRMLEERGYDLADPASIGGDEREVVDSYRAARDTAARCEAGVETGAGDIGAAVENLLAVGDFLQTERQTP
jgi:hypothetical protein